MSRPWVAYLAIFWTALLLGIWPASGLVKPVAAHAGIGIGPAGGDHPLLALTKAEARKGGEQMAADGPDAGLANGRSLAHFYFDKTKDRPWPQSRAMAQTDHAHKARAPPTIGA